MKQLILIGTVGNNLLTIQIPTNWSLEEAKTMLEQTLLEFEKQKKDGEFLTALNENELNERYPHMDSEVIKCCEIIIREVGSPVNGAGGIVWQFRVQQYLLKHPDFANRIVKSFNHQLTDEELTFLRVNYIDTLPAIVKALANL